MLRPSLTTAAAVLLGTVTFAQGNLSSRLQPVTSPIKHLGVYHLATGTWTRHATTANVTGPDTIYNNTCNVTYYGGMIQNEKWSHRSAVPSPTHPSVPTVVPGGTGFDEAPGCQSSYLVNGFQFGYCSSTAAPAPVGYTISFQNNYTLCGGGPMVPTQNFAITPLPGGTAIAMQNCWIVDVDLNAATLSFNLLADGTGTYIAPCTVDQFGVRWQLNSAPAAGNTDGPIIAGDLTWLGGPITGPLIPCKGTDGTIWDCPINLAEPATGMCSNDFFRVEMSVVADGCYFFGGNPRGDFHLELYSSACSPPNCGVGPGTAFCEPTVLGVGACVCGNPNGLGVGCANTGSSGADLTSAGVASLATDSVDPGTVTLSGTTMLSGSSCISLQGNALIAAGTTFGAGIRCTGGSLKRLYVKAISAGGVTVPQAADRSISNRSSDLLDPIAPASTRWYQIYYRDPSLPNPGGACPAVATFNVSTGQEIVWMP